CPGDRSCIVPSERHEGLFLALKHRGRPHPPDSRHEDSSWGSKRLTGGPEGPAPGPRAAVRASSPVFTGSAGLAVLVPEIPHLFRLPVASSSALEGPRRDHEAASGSPREAKSPGVPGLFGTRLLWAILGSNHDPGLV